MRLPLLIASSEKESPVIRLFAGTWKITSAPIEEFRVLVNGKRYEEAIIIGPGSLQIFGRTNNNLITIYAELL